MDETMPAAASVLRIENSHFTIRLYENLLKIDLKGSLKDEIKEALENKPVLRETIGALLSVFVPLHIRLTDVDSVNVDDTGKVKIALPLRRDIVLQLEREDAKIFVKKLNQRVSEARKRRIELERVKRKRARDRTKRSRKVPPSSYETLPFSFPTEQVDIVNKLKRKPKRTEK